MTTIPTPDDLYLSAARTAIDIEYPDIQPWLTDTCPECSEVVVDDGDGHFLYRGTLLVGCRGCHLVNPNVLGLDRSLWADWMS
jgi:hypothetical protein